MSADVCQLKRSTPCSAGGRSGLKAYDQFPSRNVTLVSRVSGAPERLAGGVKAAARDIDARLFVYSVAQRMRELAIRLALGANPARLVRRVLAEGVRIAIVGGILGVLVVVLGTRNPSNQ